MNYRDELYKGKISPEKAQKILKKEGINITVEQAEEILYFSPTDSKYSYCKIYREESNA